MRHFSFLNTKSSKSGVVFYIYSTSQLGLANFQELNSHVAGATIEFVSLMLQESIMIMPLPSSSSSYFPTYLLLLSIPVCMTLCISRCFLFYLEYFPVFLPAMPFPVWGDYFLFVSHCTLCSLIKIIRISCFDLLYVPLAKLWTQEQGPGCTLYYIFSHVYGSLNKYLLNLI